MQSDDKIKTLFASKLANFEPQPPAGMWNKINGSLSADAATKMPVRKITLWRAISVAAGIAAMLAIAFLLLPHDTPDNNNVAGKPAIPSSKTTIDEPAKTPVEPTNVQPSPAGQQFYARAYVHPNRQPVVVEPQKTADNEPEYAANNEESQENNPVQQAENTSPQNRLNDKELQMKIEEFEKAGQPDALFANASYPADNRNDNISVSVTGSSGLSELTSKKVPVPAKFLRYAMPADENYATSSYAEDQLTWLNDPRVRIEHRQPVSFGLKIDKQLNDRFSVGTGLVYTYLSSKLSPANSDYRVEGNIRFHYAGIPLYLNYTIARLGNAEFHLSAGGMIQKDISGKISGNQEFKNWLVGETENHISDKISQNNPQLSIMANAGVSYPLYKSLNMYATVGGAYYFDAKNEYRTVYSDEQLQMDVNIGLRLKF